MLKRLGNVIYWATCGWVALVVLFAMTAIYNNPAVLSEPVAAIWFAAIAIFPWLAGLAARYVLSGN